MKTIKFYSGLSLYLILYLAICIWMNSCEPKDIITEKGVQCVTKWNGSIPDCNWEAWNLKTNYGMYPEKALDK